MNNIIGPFPDPSDSRPEDKKYWFTYDVNEDCFAIARSPVYNSKVIGRKFCKGTKPYNKLFMPEYYDIWYDLPEDTDVDEEDLLELDEVSFFLNKEKEIEDDSTTFEEESSQDLTFSEEDGQDNSAPANGTSLGFGDSQMGGKIGRIIKSEFGATIEYVNGSSPWQWIEGTASESKKYKGKYFYKIKEHLKKLPENIYITLGGNPSGNIGAYDLMKAITDITPNSKVYWISPPPPAYNGTKYSHSKWYAGRKNRASSIKQSATSFPNITVIDSYEAVGFGEGMDKEGYYCDGCDGLHATSRVASKIVDSIRG